MARRTPRDRFRQLIQTGTDVFIEHGGYRRTKMADIARAMGVAAGTLFQYVESKEALFDLLLEHADDPSGAELPGTLPVATPSPQETIERVRSRVIALRGIPTLDRALEGEGGEIGEELGAIIGETYDVLSRHRLSLRLVEASALDYPELARVWFTEARVHVLGRLERYLRRRIGEGSIEVAGDVRLTARMLLETCAFWAVHRHWDPHPHEYDEGEVRGQVIAFCRGDLLRLKHRGRKER